MASITPGEAQPGGDGGQRRRLGQLLEARQRAGGDQRSFEIEQLEGFQHGAARRLGDLEDDIVGAPVEGWH